MRRQVRCAMGVLATGLLLLGTAHPAAADVMNLGTGLTSLQFVPVGDPGNAENAYGHGRVDRAYGIGKFEVTQAQYCEFLNAVAKTDTYGLYNSQMLTSRGGISQDGALNNYTYSVSAKWANRPVSYVSWGDAARFCNWLSNGQPTTGMQTAATTEDGSYTLSGKTSSADLLTVTRKPNAVYAIPSDDEWCKAAYYKGGSTYAGYWQYPTCSDTAPIAEAPPGHAGPPGSANYWTAQGYVNPTYFTTPVGAYSLSPGPYGTFDQAGNVAEWTEGTVLSMYRICRGGDYSSGSQMLFPMFSGASDPTWEDSTAGFRIVAVPEPATLSLLALAGWLAGRRRQR